MFKFIHFLFSFHYPLFLSGEEKDQPKEFRQDSVEHNSEDRSYDDFCLSDDDFFTEQAENPVQTDDYDAFFPSDEDDDWNETIEELPLNNMLPADIGMKYKRLCL